MREVAHERGICHRTVHSWIFRRKRGRIQILLQKRSRDKDSFPGMYDTSSAGHIEAGQEPLEAAIRELKEELGIQASPEQMIFVGTFRTEIKMEFHGKMFHDNQVAFVYLYDAPVNADDLILQEDEVEAIEWFDLEDVYRDCRNGVRDVFCVSTKDLELLKEYLS